MVATNPIAARPAIYVLLLGAFISTVLCSAQQVDPRTEGVDSSASFRVQDPDQRQPNVTLGGLASVAWKPQTADKGNAWWYGSPVSSERGNPKGKSQYIASYPDFQTVRSSNTNTTGTGPSLAKVGKPFGRIGVRSVGTSISGLTPNAGNTSIAYLELARTNSTNMAAGDSPLSFVQRTAAVYSMKGVRRRMSQFTTRTGRVRLDAFQQRAVAEEKRIADWQDDSYKKSLLEERRHESAMLVKYGYTARSQRSRQKGKKITIGKIKDR